MTKQVRIENADLAPYKVVVETWDKGISGEPDKCVKVDLLDHPTFMVTPAITSTRYLVIKELPT